jgi:hypothetical protein
MTGHTNPAHRKYESQAVCLRIAVTTIGLELNFSEIFLSDLVDFRQPCVDLREVIPDITKTALNQHGPAVGVIELSDLTGAARGRPGQQ